MTYFITYTGQMINPASFKKDNINLIDIAHHLSSFKLCRYGGALEHNIHYSVANHSITLYHYAVMKNLSLDIQRAVLLHDAPEAYLGDIVSSVKQLLPDYQRLETEVWGLIVDKYSLYIDPTIEKVVKELDTRILLDEVKSLVSHNYHYFKDTLEGVSPLGVKVYCDISPQHTKALFLRCCERAGIREV